MGRQEKGTKLIYCLGKYHTEKRIMRINICNKFSSGVILRNKKKQSVYKKERKDGKTGNESMFCFGVEDRMGGRD